MNKYRANKIIVEFMGNKNLIPVNVEQLSKKQQRVYLPKGVIDFPFHVEVVNNLKQKLHRERLKNFIYWV